MVPGPDGEAKFFLQVSDHPTNETTAVQEERRVVGRSYRRRIRAEWSNKLVCYYSGLQSGVWYRLAYGTPMYVMAVSRNFLRKAALWERSK